MSETMIWEIIGYIGSALVLVSLLMSSIVKLRIINAIGSLIFCIYAFKINSIPTAVMNICLVGIDLYFLFKLLKSKTSFSYEFAGADDASVKHMLSAFKDDMAIYFNPDDISKADKIILVFDKETIAGITAGKEVGEDIELMIDYSTPQYRDCKVGKYVLGLLKDDYSNAVYTGSNDKHIPYLEKVGYVKQDNKYIYNLK